MKIFDTKFNRLFWILLISNMPIIASQKTTTPPVTPPTTTTTTVSTTTPTPPVTTPPTPTPTMPPPQTTTPTTTGVTNTVTNPVPPKNNIAMPTITPPPSTMPTPPSGVSTPGMPGGFNAAGIMSRPQVNGPVTGVGSPVGVATSAGTSGPINNGKIVSKTIEIKHAHSDPALKQKLETHFQQVTKGNPNSTISVLPNYVLAKGEEQEVIDLEEYISLLDQPVVQVRIDAIILFAQRSYNFDIGFDWSGIYNRAQSVIASNNPFGFVGLGGSLNEIPVPTSPANTAFLNSNGQPSLGSSPDNNLLVDPSNFALNLFNKVFSVTNGSSAGNAFVQIPFVFGGADLNLRRLNLVLNAAESESKVKIVSRPSVLTGDGQTATINIGQQLPMQQAAINTSSGTVYKSGQVVYKSVGISLTVRPTVGTSNTKGNKDYKRITLDIKIGDIQVISGSTQSNNDGIMTNPPVLSELSVTNTVVLKSGQTTVIGGLATTSDRKTTNRVPLLYRVPVLGNLFQANLNSDSELEQFIFITPTIVEEDV